MTDKNKDWVKKKVKFKIISLFEKKIDRIYEQKMRNILHKKIIKQLNNNNK